MSLVMQALGDRPFSIPWKDGERRKEGQVEHALGPYELLLLLVIASRQHDEDGVYPADQCICYGNTVTMCKCTRIKKSSLLLARKFLIDGGLITYSEEGGKYLDVNNPAHGRKHYSYVYQLNRRMLARLKHGKDKASDAVHDVNTPVHEVNTPVHEANTTVHEANTPVHEVNTKYTIENTNNNSSSSKGGATAAAKDCLANQRGDHYLAYIKLKADLTDEQARNIDKRILSNATAGKDVDQVKSAIDQAVNTARDAQTNDFHKWIKIVMSKIKDVLKSDKPLDAKALEMEFSKPVKVKKPADKTYERIKAAWNEVCNGLKLGELEPSVFKQLRTDFEKVAYDNCDSLDDILSTLTANTFGYDGNVHTSEEMCAKMTLEERCLVVRGVLNDFL